MPVDLAAGDLVSLIARLDGWMPSLGETLWSLRKAGLLAEIGDDARACALLELTLVQIRRARRRDVDDLVSLSLEGWALYLALAYSRWGQTRTLAEDVPEPFERWRALGIVDCDAFSEYQALKRSLEANRPRQQEVAKTRGFDLDHIGKTYSIAAAPSPEIPGYQMVMLAEMTGIPPVTNNVMLFADGLGAAAKTLATNEPWLASQLAIRIVTSANDKLLDDVFSRARIAMLPARLIAMLRDALLKRLAFGLARLGATGSHGRDGVAMVGAALEILSRIAVRLRSEQLRGLFEEALTYYRSPVFRRLSTSLGAPLAHLLARVLESLTRADVLDLLPLLFALPLPEEVDIATSEHRWQDPVIILPDWFDGTVGRAGPRASTWEVIVSHLLIVAKGASAVNRSAAVYRLFKLLQWQILSDEEKKAFAIALWTPAHRDNSGVPQNINLRPRVLLTMPEEQPGQARDALLHFIAERSRQGDGGLNDRLAAIGELLQEFGELRIAIELPADVQTALITLIGGWAMDQNQSHEIERMMNQRDQRDLAALDGVAAILPHINASDDLLEKLWDKAQAMDNGRDGGGHAFAVYPVLVRRWPERKAELLDRLRRALLSDHEDEVWAAVGGLYSWINALETYSQQADTDLDDLVREVGIGVAARRLVLLRPGLRFARWVFREGPERLRRLIVRDCDHGLTALLEQANYARSEQAFDVPAIRAACFQLASAMAAASFAEEHGITGWLAAAKDDPLPEVRNAGVRERN